MNKGYREPVEQVIGPSLGKYDDIHWFSKHFSFSFCGEFTWKAWKLGKERPIQNSELWETGQKELVEPLADQFDYKYQELLY